MAHSCNQQNKTQDQPYQKQKLTQDILPATTANHTKAFQWKWQEIQCDIYTKWKSAFVYLRNCKYKFQMAVIVSTALDTHFHLKCSLWKLASRHTKYRRVHHTYPLALNVNYFVSCYCCFLSMHVFYCYLMLVYLKNSAAFSANIHIKCLHMVEISRKPAGFGNCMREPRRVDRP